MVLNIKYELYALEELASNALHQDARTLRELTRAVDTEVQRIKSALTRDVFSYLEERHGNRYVQYHRQSVITLLEETTRHARDCSDVNITEGYGVIHRGLERLLSFLEKNFPYALDQDSNAPECYLSIARKEARLNLRKLQRALADHTDPGLLNVLLDAVRKISNSRPGQDISYRWILYAREIQHELAQLLEKSIRDTDFDNELRQILYRVNYNNSTVVRYHEDYFARLLNTIETRTEKIEKLSLAIKCINQAQVKPGLKYDIHSPSLAEMLNNYLHEEMIYLEKLQQLNVSAEKDAVKLLPDVKLKLDISVAQLACLTRLFLEMKIIQNNNLTHLLTLLSKYVVTRRAENISCGSIRAKFYNVESGTRQAVKNLLLTMLSHIEQI